MENFCGVTYLRGWTAYFGISQYYRPVPELDEWIRRRMRMCYWKQWRWPRTKIKNMLALGVSLKSAIQHGCSSNSYWQMSRTPGDQPGHYQRVVTGAGFAQRERPVVQGARLHGTEEKRESFVERADLVVPPTADPHGGWCGGRRLEAVAYPIGQLLSLEQTTIEEIGFSHACRRMH